ncbi:hypothetical protein LTR86_002302 [Recurvomyces mirabilis]|nr:hypothetical protein LTR86_002302 [Recurvomyces mirabilis]
MVHRLELSISARNDEDKVVEEVTQLVDNGRWQLSGGDALERVFKFKTFKTNWEFMNKVAEKCKEQRHHPEWTNVFNRTAIKWTTHTPRGLSLKDTYMAKFCDDVAEHLGEQYEADKPKGDETFKVGSIDAAGDCCGRKEESK